MTTYFDYLLTMTHPNGRPGPGLSSAANDLADALRRSFADATYYLPRYGVHVEIREICSTCNGEGQVKSGRKMKRCPDCKGKDSVKVIVDNVALVPSAEVQIQERGVA